jgi:hypothetical protein
MKPPLRRIFMKGALEEFEASVDLPKEQVFPELEHLAFTISNVHAYVYAYFMSKEHFGSIEK